MKKVAIRRGQVWEDNATKRRIKIVGKSAHNGWTIVRVEQAASSGRHLHERTIWKFYHLVDDKNILEEPGFGFKKV